MTKTKPGQINLAFLDTLSCSLGGMIVLFFIFASMTHKGARELSIPDELSQTAVASFASNEGDAMDPNSPTLYVVTGVGKCYLTGDRADLSFSKIHNGFLLYVPHDDIKSPGIKVDVTGCSVETEATLRSIKPFKAKDAVIKMKDGSALYYNYSNRIWSDVNQ